MVIAIMSGWDIQKGELCDELSCDQDIWAYFNILFSAKSKNTTSYKFIFIRAILENLYHIDEKGILEFDNIFISFTKICWNLVIQMNLALANTSLKRSAVENILNEAKVKHSIPDGINFDTLCNEVQQEIIKNVKMKVKKYVIGAIYGDTDGKFYGFNKQSEKIQLAARVHKFMQRFQQILMNVNNYHLLEFLQSVNIYNQVIQVDCIENISRRNSLRCYREIL